METGEPVDIVWFFDRVGRWFEQRAVPTRAGMIVIVNDVTDREVMNQRAERLVELGQSLARTTTYADVQRVVARDVLPLVGASGGSLTVVDRGRGVLRFLGWSGTDPGALVPTEVPLSVRSPSTEAVETGRPVVVADPVAAAEQYPRIAEELAAVADGVVAMPLAAAGETIGTLTMTFPDLSAVSDPDRTFLSTAAAMCAQALNRAHLLDVGKRTLDELQRHLLPRELPQVTGVDLAVRYASAETGVAIGGDWYDIVPLPSGAVALVMGDVEGHDLGAAALMGLIRSALRAYLLEEHPPSVAIARTNAFLNGLAAERLVTVAVIHLHPSDRLITAVTAGHPVALVGTPAGKVIEVPTDIGPPLGVEGDGLHWPETTTALAEGAVLVMFTDGLVERHDAPISEGIDRVRAVLGDLADLEPEPLVERLLETRTGGFTDDVAVLVARTTTTDADATGRLTRRLPAAPVSVTLSRRFIRQMLSAWEVPDALAGDVELVVSELVTNATRATEEPLELVLSRPHGRLRVEVSDCSHQEPRPAAEQNGERTDGRGLHLVETLSSRWGTETDGLDKTVWVEFDLPG
jgi:anti-sigma regulatory factor (Ser/Thr protein kinase)